MAWESLPSSTSLITTGMNSLANNGRAGSSAVTGNTAKYGTFSLYVTYGVAPVAGTTVDLYLVNSVDGTNYSDGHDASLDPDANMFVGSFLLRAVTTAQRKSLVHVLLPPGSFKAVLINKGGQTMASSGNTLIYAAYSEV